MKNTSIGYACIILVLLIWVALAKGMMLSGQHTSGQLVTVATVPDYTYRHRMVAWAKWMHIPRRRRCHDTRRHHLPGKQRRRLQLQLRRILKRQRHAALKWKRKGVPRFKSSQNHGKVRR